MEHIIRVKGSCYLYNITPPLHIFNIEETIVSINEMTGQKTLCNWALVSVIIQKVARKFGELDHMTIIGVVSAMSHMYKPVFIFPGDSCTIKKLMIAIPHLTDYPLFTFIK